MEQNCICQSTGDVANAGIWPAYSVTIQHRFDK